MIEINHATSTILQYVNIYVYMYACIMWNDCHPKCSVDVASGLGLVPLVLATFMAPMR